MNPYDVVVYGATGFTGRQAARYLADRARGGSPLRWAIAGRDQKRLDALARDLGADVGVLVADAADEPALARLVGGTRVVLSFAGPYARYGGPLVAACARAGVDYVDITGETPHVRRLIDRHHDEAARTGAKIVPFCGFDSVPSDLGVLLLVHQFRTRGVGTRSVKGFFRTHGEFNRGSAASMLELWRNPADVRAMEDPLFLNPADRRSAPEAKRNPDLAVPRFDTDVGRWVAPFIMAPINTRVVRRSRALSAAWGEDYGNDFRYEECFDPGGSLSWASASGAAWGMSMYRVISRLPWSADALTPFVQASKAGPSEASMNSGWFRAQFIGTDDTGARAWGEIADRGDPGNRVTVKIACESALTLVYDRASLPGGASRGGVLTPATALGLPLAARLRAAGMTVTPRLESSG